MVPLLHGGRELELIAGQKPVATKARKSIAGFKLREGMPIGAMSVAVPAVRAKRAKIDEIRTALRGAIRQATVSTGGILPREVASLWADAPAPTPTAQRGLP